MATCCVDVCCGECRSKSNPLGDDWNVVCGVRAAVNVVFLLAEKETTQSANVKTNIEIWVSFLL